MNIFPNNVNLISQKSWVFRLREFPSHYFILIIWRYLFVFLSTNLLKYLVSHLWSPERHAWSKALRSLLYVQWHEGAQMRKYKQMDYQIRFEETLGQLPPWFRHTHINFLLRATKPEWRIGDLATDLIVVEGS